MKITKVEIAGRKVNFDKGTTEVTLALTYEGGVLHLKLPVSSNPQGDAEELHAAKKALLDLAHASIEAVGSLR